MLRLKADNDDGVDVTLREQYLIDKINAVVASLQQARRPDLSGDDLMEIPVPDPDFTPTQESVDAASAVLIKIQDDLNAIPEGLAWLNEKRIAMSVTYANTGGGFPRLDYTYTDAMFLADSLYDEWTQYQSLRMQQMAIWAAAVAKMEHDLQWQAYVSETYGASPADIARKARPRVLVKGLNA